MFFRVKQRQAKKKLKFLLFPFTSIRRRRLSFKYARLDDMKRERDKKLSRLSTERCDVTADKHLLPAGDTTTNKVGKIEDMCEKCTSPIGNKMKKVTKIITC